MALLNELWEELNDSAFLRSLKRVPQGSLAYENGRRVYDRYRSTLRRARPFVISTKAMQVAYDLSIQGSNKVATKLPLARLPFDTVWIELDFFAKTAYAASKGFAIPPDVYTPRLIGWLLERDENNPARWTATCFTSMTPPQREAAEEDKFTEPKVSFFSLTLFIDTENIAPPDKIGRNEALRLHELPDEGWREFRQFVWGWTDRGVTEPSPTLRIGMPPNSLYNAANVGFEALSATTMMDMPHHRRIDVLRNAAAEARGDARLLVCLLALINEVPIEYVQTKPQGSFRARGGTITKWLSYSTVDIMIPAKRPLRIVEKILRNAEARRKQRHEVRGHWRTIKHKSTHTRKIKHPDGRIEERTFQAGELERVWVKDHERGDASLGWIEHNYDVKKAK